MRIASCLLLLACLGLSAGEDEKVLPPPERLAREAVEFAQAQAKGFGGHCAIRATKLHTLPRVKGTDIQFEPSHLSKREPTGAFFAVFRVRVDGRLVGSARIELEGRWTGRLLKTAESMARKTIPTEAQLEAFDFEGNPPPGALEAFPAGYRLRNAVPMGHTLTQTDLEPIPLVNAGERVRLTLRSGSLIISAEATARGPGALGDKIRVELPTRKWVQAVVTGPGEASVEWSA